MSYENLSHRQMFYLAQRLPERPRPQALHAYVEKVRKLLDGKDPINIPESHKGIWRGENHEGSHRLNRRMTQLANWLGEADMRFSVQASGPGDAVQRGTSIQERFIRQGERELSAGTDLHNWHQEYLEDVAGFGVGVFQQNPRKEYYIEAESDPESMAAGARLGDVIWRTRVDPETWSWDEDKKGDLAAVTVVTNRLLSELAPVVGAEGIGRLFDWFDFGTGMSPNDPDSWKAGIQIQTAEVWGPTNGGLVVLSGPASKPGFRSSKQARVLAEWDNPIGRPPFYVAAAFPWPWHSPLDEMVALTEIRNYYATMEDVQTAGAIFRHWQLTDRETGEDLTATRAASVPEAILYDPSKPPPYMGPGTEWKLAPFEYQSEVKARLADIRAQQEEAGASVARLMGVALGAETPVGTADLIEDSAKREFSGTVEAVQLAAERAWRDLTRWARNHHTDKLYVVDKRRDTEGEDPGIFINTALTLDPKKDIQSEHIEARLDTRSMLAKIRDAAYAADQIAQGLMDFERAVEMGLLWGVDDAEAEKLAIFISKLEQVEATVELKAAAVKAQNALLGPQTQPFQGVETNFLGGTRPDPRSTGAGMGADNIRGTGAGPSGSDTAGRAA